MTDTESLPAWKRPLAVVAHPDDESFGLGAVLTAFVDAGAHPTVLCLTHGEASTLHGVPGDLHDIRAHELRDAARALAIDDVHDVHLLDEPDGALAAQPFDRLVGEIVDAARTDTADGLLVFDLGGITGHPDHDTATRAALDAAATLGLDVLAWTLPENVAATLRAETGAPFVGRTPHEIDVILPVHRDRQRDAVQAHPSQAVPGSVLWRRLDLLGNTEHLRWLHLGGISGSPPETLSESSTG